MTLEHSGDFRLLNPFPVLTDEDGEYHCPMPIVIREIDAYDHVTYTKALCGEVLHVAWSLVCPIPDPGDTIKDAQAAGEWAVASWWELKCSNGHVLLTSADGNGDQDPQPFDMLKLFGAPLVRADG